MAPQTWRPLFVCFGLCAEFECVNEGSGGCVIHHKKNARAAESSSGRSGGARLRRSLCLSHIDRASDALGCQYTHDFETRIRSSHTTHLAEWACGDIFVEAFILRFGSKTQSVYVTYVADDCSIREYSTRIDCGVPSCGVWVCVCKRARKGRRQKRRSSPAIRAAIVAPPARALRSSLLRFVLENSRVNARTAVHTTTPQCRHACHRGVNNRGRG